MRIGLYVDAEISKHPGAVLDYQFDWSSWLDGDTISNSSWSEAEGITKETETNSTTTATIWLSGGTAEQSYRLVNTIVTAVGRTEKKALVVTVTTEGAV